MLENREDGEKEKATLIMADGTKKSSWIEKGEENELQVVIGLDENNNKISRVNKEWKEIPRSRIWSISLPHR